MAIGRKHGASAAQVALKWLLDQDGVAAIPKASRAESQKANLDALHIGLDDEDRAAIAGAAEEQAFCESRLCARMGLSFRSVPATLGRIAVVVSFRKGQSPSLKRKRQGLGSRRSPGRRHKRKWPLSGPFP